MVFFKNIFALITLLLFAIYRGTLNICSYQNQPRIRTEEYFEGKIYVSIKSIHGLENSFSDNNSKSNVKRQCLLPEICIFFFILSINVSQILMHGYKYDFICCIQLKYIS